MPKKFRIIPKLDVKSSFIIKGVNFEGMRKIGSAKKFAKKYYLDGADELIVNDVNASLITTELNETYDNYVELGQVQLDNNTNNEVINDNITDTEDIQVSENISKS